MPHQKIDVNRFGDISLDGPIDLSEYVVDAGTSQDGLYYAEFCIPYSVLPIDRIDTEAFDKYLGTIRMHPPVTMKDSLGLFDIQKPADCYFLTLFEQ